MKLLTYLFAVLTLFALTSPAFAKKPPCVKCDAKGTFRCGPEGSTHVQACGDDLCWAPSGKDCAAGSHCIEGESVYCKNTAEACAGCDEFFAHCVKVSLSFTSYSGQLLAAMGKTIREVNNKIRTTGRNAMSIARWCASVRRVMLLVGGARTSV
ncbi:hypothetical protein NX059_006156 [Plenodomus lindquistii]|nr:hypothetical protein NX059_006156 [Plenodomus lindquistii]